MKLRIVVMAFVGLMGMAGLAPLGGAQVPAWKLDIGVKFDHDMMEVPENGRADMPVTVTAVGANWACAQPATITVPLKLDSFAKWAGSSMEPKEVTFPVQAGQPGASEFKFPDQVTKLNLAWDVESRPGTGAKQEYFISVRGDEVRISGSCAPSGQARGNKFGPMTATMPDKPPQATGTVVDCAADPFQAACQTTGATAEANSPGFDVAILVASLAVVGVLWRRRL